jgi:nitrate reductase delta subunit
MPRDVSVKTYKVLSALLDYPTPALIAALPELQAALDAERALPQPVRCPLDALFAELAAEDLLDAQEAYVALFDRVRSLSLNLFEHVHGESRDRGQALVDLQALYEGSGFALVGRELPDYLPAFLEYLSRLEPAAAKTLLAETAAILKGICARLAKRGSNYAAVFEALLALAGDAAQLERPAYDDGDSRDDDPAALDAQWEEQPAFAPGPQCGAAHDRGASVVRFHRRAA